MDRIEEGPERLIGRGEEGRRYEERGEGERGEGRGGEGRRGRRSEMIRDSG